VKPRNRETVKPSIGILILAAGASRRLGRPKQLLKLEGDTFLRRMARMAVLLDVGPAAVVLGARAEAMRPELNGLDVHLVDNPDWAEGMSTSLRAGVRFLETLEPKVEAVLVLLVDQPRVDADLLQDIIHIYREQRPPLVASFYNDMPGVPALFDRSLFAELQSITGDRGARRVIRNYEEELISVPFPGGALDVDTEKDFWRVKE
jgi:molybdenum cofactor cytidylyltransferase